MIHLVDMNNAPDEIKKYRVDIPNESKNYPVNGENYPAREENHPEIKMSTKEIIISLVKQNPNITRKKLAQKCGISIDVIKWQLKQLKDIVKHVGSGKAGHWEIITDKLNAVDK